MPQETGDCSTRQSKIVGPLVTLIQYPDGTAITPGYDQAHRLNSIFNNFGENIKYYFDYAGDVVAEAIANVVGTVFYSHYADFDVIGRKTQDEDSFSNVTTYSYLCSGQPQADNFFGGQLRRVAPSVSLGARSAA
jgi:YD repeat-containing protein